VPVTIMPDADHHEYGDYRAWYVKDVSFEAGQSRSVRNVYTGTEGATRRGIWPSNTFFGAAAPGRPDRNRRHCGHVGPSEAPIDSVDIRPTGYRISGNEIRWHFVSLNPRKAGRMTRSASGGTSQGEMTVARTSNNGLQQQQPLRGGSLAALGALNLALDGQSCADRPRETALGFADVETRSRRPLRIARRRRSCAQRPVLRACR